MIFLEDGELRRTITLLERAAEGEKKPLSDLLNFYRAKGQENERWEKLVSDAVSTDQSDGRRRLRQTP